MANNDKIKRSIIENVVVISIMVLYIVYGMHVAPLLMVIIPLPFIVIGIRNGIENTIISMAITSLIVGVLVEIYLGMSLFLIFMPISLGITYCIKERKKVSETVLIGAGAFFISIALVFLLESKLGGLDFVKSLEQDLAQFLALQLDMMKEMGLTNYEILQTEDLLEMTYDYMIILIPSLLFVTSLVISYVNNIFSFIVLRRMGYGISRYPGFSKFKLPNNIMPGMAVMFIATFIIGKLNIPYHEALLLNITFLIGFIFFVQGLSVLDFLLKKIKIRLIFRVMIIILNVLLVPIGGIIFFIGVLDSIFDMRKIRK